MSISMAIAKKQKIMSIVREAIKDWVLKHMERNWPKSVMEFKGIKEFPDMEEIREGVLDLNQV